ncbi:MAG: hypothetical protein CMP95_10090 [Gammaproteobacteria bacterium]|nr:hypothetical protein [Gammaproteobacteria bacterium]OUV67345.1 MAG: hypothetical protein CBC93_05760 [Gammaproteobacteria bacterium TMED133]
MLDISTKAYRNVKLKTAEQFENTLAWVARSIEANPSNYEKLLTINPEGFAIMLKNGVRYRKVLNHS